MNIVIIKNRLLKIAKMFGNRENEHLFSVKCSDFEHEFEGLNP